jgi:beta-barrel assembly-enhancing protease
MMLRRSYNMSMVTLRNSLLFLLLLPLVSGCATTRRDTQKWVILPTAFEVSVGQSVAAGIHQQFKPLNDKEIETYVQSLGYRIVSVCERQDLDYHFEVLDSPEVNAMAAPGGYVYVTTGLLAAAENEAEVAIVIGHEVGHIAAKHGAQRIQTAFGLSLAVDLLNLDRKSDLFQGIAGLGVNLALNGYSRENEYEADHLGMVYACRLGYDPKAAVTFFEKLKKVEKRQPALVEIWFSTHPATQNRIAEYDKTKAELPCQTGRTNAQRYQQVMAPLKARKDLQPKP